MSEELMHELVKLTYSDEIVNFELSREQGLEILKEIERLNNIIKLANYYIDNYMYEKYAYCGSEERLKQILSGNELILKQLQERKGSDKSERTYTRHISRW